MEHDGSVIGNFGSFFALWPLTTQKIKILKKQKTTEDIMLFNILYCIILHNRIINGWSYDVRSLRYGVQRTESLGHFFHFYSKIKILKKWNTYLEISCHTCALKNDNHMMYGSWDMECKGQNILSFWAIYYPSNDPKSQTEKIGKKLMEQAFF